MKASPNISGHLAWVVLQSSLGPLLLTASAQGLCRLAFSDDQTRQPTANLPVSSETPDVAADAVLQLCLAPILALVENPADTVPSFPVDLQGSPFQQRVWAAIRRIPAGSTGSYLEIAGRIGQPTAVRAVAQACGANPLAIVIPCHRVIRSDGSLGGYHWGMNRKAELLRREKDAWRGGR